MLPTTSSHSVPMELLRLSPSTAGTTSYRRPSTELSLLKRLRRSGAGERKVVEEQGGDGSFVVKKYLVDPNGAGLSNTLNIKTFPLVLQKKQGGESLQHHASETSAGAGARLRG